MVDSGLAARSALAGIIRPDVVGMPLMSGVTLTERINLQMIGLAAASHRVPAVIEAMRAEWRLALPLVPRYVEGHGLAAVWAGPQRWILLAEADADLLACLHARMAGLASVTEQGDGRCVLRVNGPCAQASLAKLLPIDLHPRTFSEGDTALTVAAHMHVHLWQIDARPTYDLAVSRSYAVSFFAALTAAAAEFGVSLEV
jgi:methylglutamate dehydrogenase subunit D